MVNGDMMNMLTMLLKPLSSLGLLIALSCTFQSVHAQAESLYPEGEKAAVEAFTLFLAKEYLPERIEKWQSLRHELLQTSLLNPPQLYSEFNSREQNREVYYLTAFESNGDFKAQRAIFHVDPKQKARGLWLGEEEKLSLKDIDGYSLEELFGYRYKSASLENVKNFAAWLYKYQKPWAANRVLSYYAEYHPESEKLIHAYIKEKQGFGKQEIAVLSYGKGDRKRVERAPQAFYEQRKEAYETWCNLEIAVLVRRIEATFLDQRSIPWDLLEHELERVELICDGSDALLSHQEELKAEPSRKEQRRQQKLLAYWKPQLEARLQEVNTLKQKIDTLYQEENYKELEEPLKKLLEGDGKTSALSPNEAYLWFRFGRVLNELAQPTPRKTSCGKSTKAREAIKAFEVVLGMVPDSPEAKLHKAFSHMVLQDYKKARGLFDEILADQKAAKAYQESAESWKEVLDENEKRHVSPDDE